MIHHRLMLGQIISHLDFLDEAIEKVSKEVENRLAPFLEEIELLATITGVKQKAAEGVISEIGVDMSRFPTHRRCASWTALCQTCPILLCMD